jgi:hypothetical protein
MFVCLHLIFVGNHLHLKLSQPIHLTIHCVIAVPAPVAVYKETKARALWCFTSHMLS